MPDAAGRSQITERGRRPAVHTLMAFLVDPAGPAAVAVDAHPVCRARIAAGAAAAARSGTADPVGVLARGLFLLLRWLPAATSGAFIRRQFPFPDPTRPDPQSRP